MGSERKTPYHHGNLREALIDSALEILEEQGLEALSLRAIARRSGVSQTAPYSHFSDRGELLARVAERGFDLFIGVMSREAEAAGDTGRLAALGVGYVRFALQHPALFRLMFSYHHAAPAPDEALSARAGAAFELLRGALAGHGPGHADRDASLAAWSLVHGLAELALHNRIELPATPEAQRQAILAILGHLSP